MKDTYFAIPRLGTKIAAVAFAVVVGSALFAQSLPAGLDARLVAVANGPSGLKWIGGNHESPLMNPGMDCIACHAKGEGPRLLVAGTAYTKIDEKDLDFGVEGAVIQVTDTKGTVVKLTSNKAGNFSAGRNANLVAPLNAKVLFKGKERMMYSQAPNGDCAACHQAKGVNGAPGRIMVP